MKPLRIAMVAQAVYPVRGGVEMHVHSLASLLQAQGHNLTVFSRQQVPRDPCHSYRIHDGLNLASLLRKTPAGGFDVVHAHGVRDPFSATALIRAHALGIRTCVTPHCFYQATTAAGQVKRLLYDNTLGRIALTSSDAVICLTKAGMQDALQQPGIRPGRIHIIANAIMIPPPPKNEEIQAMVAQHGDFLLCVGRLDKVKRGDFLIRALRALPASLRLLFVGPDAGAYNAWKQEALANGLADRVTFLLDAPDHVLAAAYKAARAVVMASAQEGLPTVLLEAMAAGVPVIASDRGGIPELVTHGTTGLLFAYDDEHAYVSCVHRILSQNNQEITQAARLLVEEQYTWKSNATRVLKAYGHA